jgi:hypothetical protein
MFRIEAFVDDAKLVSVLYALSGKVKSLDVQPVINIAAKSNGKIESATEGTLVALFAEYLKNNDEKVDTAMAKTFLESIGRAPGSSQYLMRQAVENKLITRHGKGNATTYKKVDHK